MPQQQDVLVEGTPTKKKVAEVDLSEPPKQPQFRPASSLIRKGKKPLAKAFTVASQTRPSTFAASLARRRAEPSRPELPSLERSSSFAKRTIKGKEKEVDNEDELEVVKDGTEREDDLTMINDLPLGPGEFGLDPEGEEEWRALEPNSGIRLSKRNISHADVQDHLYGRYHLRPAQVYSVARLSRDGATYDVPVDNDWVTIAVVAERSDIRVSGLRDVVSDDEEDEPAPGDSTEQTKEKSKLAAAKNKKNRKEKTGNRRQPRKYINLKLVALPPRSKSLGATGVSGDAFFQLLLFEADCVVRESDGEGGEKRSYRGGSGGAYEKWCNLGVGSVIAILNPRILRPLKSGGGAPHPLTLPLALNPLSGDSITHIGQAMDLGCCTALQRDGNRCKTWVDTRVSNVCEYHIHAAVKRGRSSRAEFASATTSYELETRTSGRFGSSSSKGPQGDFDTFNPRLKRGLMPANAARSAPRGSADGGGGATYVVGTAVARTRRSEGALPAFGDAHLGERLGRSQGEKRKRKMENAEAEKALALMLERGGDDGSVGAKYLAAMGLAPEKEKQDNIERTRVFSASAIKRIGFDPSGQRYEDPEKRGATIASLKEVSSRPLKLGRPPGPKRLSNVVVPPTVPKPQQKQEEEIMVDLD